MSAGIRRSDDGEAELYFLQQHYHMWTRLLDWTSNALVGLFFAVSSNPDQDGMLFMMDAYQLGPTQQARAIACRAERTTALGKQRERLKYAYTPRE